MKQDGANSDYEFDVDYFNSEQLRLAENGGVDEDEEVEDEDEIDGPVTINFDTSKCSCTSCLCSN